MGRGTINVDPSVHEAFEKFCRARRQKPGLATGNLLEWFLSISEDAQNTMLGRFSPEAEARLYELLLQRAVAQIDNGEPIGRSAVIHTEKQKGGRARRERGVEQ